MKNKASTRDLIDNKISYWNRSLQHKLASEKIQHSTDHFESTKKLLKTKAIYVSADITVSKEEFTVLLKKYHEKTNYRIDVKAFSLFEYDMIKNLVVDTEIPYTEFDSFDRSKINLNADPNRLGIWKEEMKVEVHFFKMIINTGLSSHPYLNINVHLI